MRKTLSSNENWQFTGPDGTTRAVYLPHIWSSTNEQDGDNGYWHGSCTYRRKLAIPEFNKDGEQVYLEFQGVNVSARTSLDGSPVYTHDGGYSTFRVDVTGVLTENNLLKVTMGNNVNNRVYPRKTNFTFYGSTYWGANLIVLNKLHFDMDYYGESGIQITLEVGGNTSTMGIRTFTDVTKSGNEVRVRVNIEDGDGKKVVSGIGAGCALLIPKVHLWGCLEDLYLYTATTRLTVQGKQMDTVSSRFGVRSLSVDAQERFFLNGRSYPLQDVSRHQD